MLDPGPEHFHCSRCKCNKTKAEFNTKWVNGEPRRAKTCLECQRRAREGAHAKKAEEKENLAPDNNPDDGSEDGTDDGKDLAVLPLPEQGAAIIRAQLAHRNKLWMSSMSKRDIGGDVALMVADVRRFESTSRVRDTTWAKKGDKESRRRVANTMGQLNGMAGATVSKSKKDAMSNAEGRFLPSRGSEVNSHCRLTSPRRLADNIYKQHSHNFEKSWRNSLPLLGGSEIFLFGGESGGTKGQYFVYFGVEHFPREADDSEISARSFRDMNSSEYVHPPFFSVWWLPKVNFSMISRNCGYAICMCYRPAAVERLTLKFGII
ncbi:hypothetical protein C8R46DRAFT_1027825 [Mycena filopes]|nr:hypothetical protein C8R46DRAFT_1027825 [Mycena filopes]